MTSTPTPIAANGTKSNYIISVWDMAEWRYIHVRCALPHALHPLQHNSMIQFNLYVVECRCTHMTPFCHRKHIIWLECFHVTTGNNWSWHSVLFSGVIINYLMHHFYLYEKSICIHVLLSTFHACDELWYSMICLWCTFSIAIIPTSLYICIPTQVMYIIHCDGHNLFYQTQYISYHFVW